MKRYLIVFLCFLITNCHGQTRVFGESPLILEKFDFSLDVKAFFPEKYKHKTAEDYFEIPVSANFRPHIVLIKREIVLEDRYSEDKKVARIEYGEKNYSTADTLAVFENQAFCSLNIASTPDHKIIALNAKMDNAGGVEKAVSERFIQLLTKKYGNYAKYTRNAFSKDFEVYRWVTKDKIIQYSPIYADGSNAIVVDKDKGTIKNGGKDLRLEGYFYIVKKEYEKELTGKMGSNDFFYFK